MRVGSSLSSVPCMTPRDWNREIRREIKKIEGGTGK
jgi:hypothetical protein